MKKILISVSKATVLILMLSLSSCYYDEVIVIDEVVPDPVENVSYATDIQPIFTESCAQCHPSAAPPDLTAGSSYTAINNGVYIVPFDIDASELYQTLIGIGSPMPPAGSLSASEINLVKSWIEQGAENN